MQHPKKSGARASSVSTKDVQLQHASGVLATVHAFEAASPLWGIQVLLTFHGKVGDCEESAELDVLVEVEMNCRGLSVAKDIGISPFHPPL